LNLLTRTPRVLSFCASAPLLLHRLGAVTVVLALGSLAASPALGLQAAAAPAQSSAASVHLDPARTTVTFTAGSLKRIHGTFQLKGGLFAFDSTSGVAQGEILVDAESEKSNDAKLDQKIRTQTLEVAKYPGISFHPENSSGSLPSKDGESHFKLKGTFTIHGTDHPLEVDVDAVQADGQVVFKSTFTVPYVAWGMKDASSFFMRDRDIHVMIESHGVVEHSKPSA
jgi:polyisoprenoid-binding protein YceI